MSGRIIDMVMSLNVMYDKMMYDISIIVDVSTIKRTDVKYNYFMQLDRESYAKRIIDVVSKLEARLPWSINQPQTSEGNTSFDRASLSKSICGTPP